MVEKKSESMRSIDVKYLRWGWNCVLALHKHFYFLLFLFSVMCTIHNAFIFRLCTDHWTGLRVRWIGSHLWRRLFFELHESEEREKINSTRLRWAVMRSKRWWMDHVFRRWSIDTVSINLKKDFSARDFHLKIAEITAQQIREKTSFFTFNCFSRRVYSSFTPPPCNSTCYGIYCQLHLLRCQLGSCL